VKHASIYETQSCRTISDNIVEWLHLLDLDCLNDIKKIRDLLMKCLRGTIRMLFLQCQV